MTPIDLETTDAEGPDRTSARRRRWTWITIATVGIISASALLAVPAIATDGTNPDHSSDHTHDRVVVCDSGVTTDGDIQMSAASATRLPSGDTTPLPADCRDG